MTTTSTPLAGQETVFYFGCGRSFGHFWFTPQMRHWHGDGPLSEIDGVYAPEGKHLDDQGKCSLRFVGDWTVLAWWDRSVDPRPKSNSALVVRGALSFDQMVEALRFYFPTLFGRQPELLELVDDQRPNVGESKPDASTSSRSNQQILDRAEKLRAEITLDKNTIEHWNREHPGEAPISTAFEDEMLAQVDMVADRVTKRMQERSR